MTSSSSDQSIVAKPKKSFLEIQPYLFTYGFGISLFSPTASLYQLVRLNPQVKLGAKEGVMIALRILPHQTLLKALQMNASTPVKEYFNPWAAFGLVGVLQGGVYGQSNIYFAGRLKIGEGLSYRGVFRGFGFAGCRDMLSQGIPYVFSKSVEKHIADKIYDTSDDPNGVAAGVKRWASVFASSIFATYASQGFHNCQITMHADQTLSHVTAVHKAWKQNGVSLLWKGGEARVGLLLVVNILNELVLKKAWE